MVSVFDRIRQTICGFHGHDALLQFDRDRLYLKCYSCGFESPGWTVSPAVDAQPPEIAALREEPHRTLVQPGLVGARRVA